MKQIVMEPMMKQQNKFTSTGEESFPPPNGSHFEISSPVSESHIIYVVIYVIYFVENYCTITLTV